MSPQQITKLTVVLLLAAAVVVPTEKVLAQAAPPTAPATAPAAPVQPGAVVRRVVMKDALAVESFRAKLETLKSSGLFKDQLPGFDPKKPVPIEISFLTSGNYLLVIGSREWVDANVDSIRLMAYLFERPRAHLEMNMRVVQLTGPANADVIQMSEAVTALVDAQRDEVVRTFADLADYLLARMKARAPEERKVFESVRSLLPSFADGTRPLTVPEMLLLLMVDRASPAPKAAVQAGEADADSEAALLGLSRTLSAGLQDPHRDDAALLAEIKDDLAAWKKAVTAAKQWCGHYGEELKKKDSSGLSAFRAALQQPDSAMPTWITHRLQRSLELTERLYPTLVKRHMQESLLELERRFQRALDRADALQADLAHGEPAPAPAGEKGGNAAPVPGGSLRTNLVALKSLAEELVPAPLALFDAVALAADNAAPTPDQLIQMFGEYAAERSKLDTALADDAPRAPQVNYARLQALEAGLNLWLRRTSEAMARSLEQQFYRRYVNEVRLLANKQLGKGSSRDILEASNIGEVPDVTRDILLADTGVNIFLSNSISMQFAPDTMNSVAATVQSSLPSKLGLLEKVQQASTAASALSAITQTYGIDGASIVKALLSGGQAVPVQSGITLQATPSIGFDASTVALTMTANETLQPDNNKVADRVTNHSINNATITALSYEPMVLSTLASNVSYYESVGGIPLVRKVPIVGKMIRDIPFAPFKEGKRQKGVYQSSVLILEPVVIPTIEDLVRFHAGWREAGPSIAMPATPVMPTGVAAGAPEPAAPTVAPTAMPVAAPAPAPTAAPAPAK